MAKKPISDGEIRVENKARKAAKNRSAKKKMSPVNLLMVVSVIVIFAIALGLVGVNALMSSGITERHTTVMSTVNDSVTTSMLTYYFNASYRNTANSYASLGLDTTKSLKEQQFPYGSTSWYDFFLNNTVNEVASYLIMASGAKEEGIELTQEELDEVEAVIDSFKEAAKIYGYSASKYIKLNFGSAVSVGDMRKGLLLAELASKYQEVKTEEYKGTFGSDDYDKQYKDNKNNYDYVDYYSYTFTAEKGSDGNMTTETKAAAKALAEELKAAADAEAFKEYVETYLTNKARDELKEGEELDKTEIVDTVNSLLTTHAAYSTLNSASADIAKWAYESAEAGDVKENYNDTNGTYTVYMLDKTPYRDEYITRNGAVIFISNANNTDAEGASAKADEIIAEWNGGDKTQESFIELAEKYTESGHAHLEENIKKGPAYSDWLYSPERVIGDVDKVVSESDKGVYIVYYAGESGLQSWQADAQSDLASAAFNDRYTELYNKYYVTVNDKKAARVVPVSVSAGGTSSTGSTSSK